MPYDFHVGIGVFLQIIQHGKLIVKRGIGAFLFNQRERLRQTVHGHQFRAGFFGFFAEIAGERLRGFHAFNIGWAFDFVVVFAHHQHRAAPTIRLGFVKRGLAFGRS